MSAAPPEREGRGPVGVPRPAGASRYGWFLGVVLVLFLGYVTLNTVTSSHGSRSVGPAVGERLPSFAVPLASSHAAESYDANVFTRPQGGHPAACSIQRPDVINVCRLEDHGPVVLAFLATRGAQCELALDRIERVRRGFPGVQVAAVAIRGDLGDVRRLTVTHGWHFPVGYDRDGILANLYGVAVCPQTTFALPGGRVRGTAIGQLAVPALRARFAALVAAARHRGWRPPGA